MIFDSLIKVLDNRNNTVLKHTFCNIKCYQNSYLQYCCIPFGRKIALDILFDWNFGVVFE